MASPKDGSAGSIVAPQAPPEAVVADVADPGAMGPEWQRSRERAAETPPPGAPTPDPESEEAKKEVWIEFVLIDDDDNPVPGEPYKVTLPDGTSTTGTTNEKGLVRVEGIDPGSCKITFPRWDESSWHDASVKPPKQSVTPGPVAAPTTSAAPPSAAATTPTSTPPSSAPAPAPPASSTPPASDGSSSATSPPAAAPTEDTITVVNESLTSTKAVRVLKEILKAAGLKSAKITSGSRDAYNQARVMYDNIVEHGVDHQKNLYAAAGDKVIDVYVANKDKSREEIIEAMKAKVIELGPSTVSKHCSDDYDVIDVAPSSISDGPAFVKAAKAHSDVTNFLEPPDDPAYHLEIPKD
ncbi:MAG: carboxypeptidase regulatory-like domain-containing protein [Phycisphaerae bacterium]|nr:carboxypeptidase regulatory-like domain-containing protein [Phycisphaerae bacterium]